MVRHPSAAVQSFEAMLMAPQFVWAGQLNVFEIVRWIPARDLCDPTKRNAMPNEPVTDVNSGCDFSRNRHHAKLQPIRSQQLQIARVAEELKHVAQRPGNPLFAMNGVS